MRTVYKVTVEAMVYDDAGDFVRSETLFDATHHRPESLLRFAPIEVDSALREQVYADTPQKVTGLVDVEALKQAVSDYRADETPEVPASGNEQPVDEPATSTDDKPKRKRRTRAEIEAERARLAAEANVPEPQTQVSMPTPEVPEDVTVTTSLEGIKPIEAPPAVPVPADGQPWNPFKAQ
jgi:hypothetical protein